jgi:hypothetical protein
VRTIGGLVASIAASSVAANIVTAGRMFRSEVERRGYAPVVARARHRRHGRPDLHSRALELLRRLYSLMTILIAVLGVRMLKGAQPTVREDDVLPPAPSPEGRP